jgi:uncharacterized protein (DUF488 family)
VSGEIPAIYTVGHSIHSADAFLQLLDTHAIKRVADVRLIPGSQRHPHFSREALSTLLEAAGIAYHHFPDLGGRRRPRPDSINTAWRVDAFRGYADYMASGPFLDAVARLTELAGSAATAVMCAEAKWWQCHRRLLADTLVARQVPVFHILSSSPPRSHELSEFAIATDGRVTYPGLL